MVLELQKVCKSYGSLHALKDIDMRVNPGEWVSIMGSSGSGKTTLLNIIGGLDRPTSGRVILDGADLSSLSQRQLTEVRRDKIGLIFQQFHLIPHLTALENVMVAQYYHSMPDENEAREALARVGLAGRAHHFPSQLSGGEQQRVCVARALINYPALILADEPTGNLDSQHGAEVMALLKQLNKEGTTVVMVTHSRTDAGHARRVINLLDGHVVAEGLKTDGEVVSANFKAHAA